MLSADEVGKRYSLFYLLGCVASAFAGILAYGVSRNPQPAGVLVWQNGKSETLLLTSFA